MKVVICGSRGITDKEYAFYCISNSNFDIAEVVSGHAKGVDLIGEEYAIAKGFPVKIFEPDWNKYGRTAGIIRDKAMVSYADAIIAIWDGKSKGTYFTINYAKSMGKPIRVWVR